MTRIAFPAGALTPQIVADALSVTAEFDVVAEDEAVIITDGSAKMRVSVEEGVTAEAIVARIAGSMTRDFRFRGLFDATIEDDGRTLCIDEYRRKSPAPAPVRQTRR